MHRMLGNATGLGLIAGTALFGSSAAAQCFDSQAEVATYEVVFIAEWSEATHSTAFPNNPHFSPLIGGTHSDAVSFWEPGGIATPGIERMAETGGPNLLRNEVLAAIGQGTAGAVVQGGAVALSPDQIVTSFEIDQNNPLITLVTMIAPSPDWFVGTHGLALRDDDGWMNFIEVDLWAYDSGTDSGANYTSGNQNTSPFEPIRNITGEFPFEGHGRIGRFQFFRTGPSLIPDLAPPCGVINIHDLFVYLAMYNSGDARADLAEPFGELNFFDVAAYVTAFSNAIP